MNTIKKITLVGAGNVATHLGKALINKGFIINQIYSKSIENATILAAKLNASPYNRIQDLNDESDIYIISIKDSQIEKIITCFPFKNRLVVHTSGSISIKVFSNFNRYGVLYPLQTFSKEKQVDVSGVPFCIEGNTKETENELLKLSKTLSESVQLINSEERKKIHLAAVFACNFSNYLYTISEEILEKSNIDFNILKPLILETAKKIQKKSPKLVQTGPAIRKDELIIKNQLKMLADNPNYQEIYKIITENIIKNS